MKALCTVAGSLLAAWGIVCWIHAGQVEKTAERLKADASAAKEEGSHDRAFDLFEQYLTLRPKDNDVLEDVSELLDEHGGSRTAILRAMRINDDLIRQDRSRSDLRLRQVRLAERLGRFADAETHLKSLRENQSEESDVWYYSAVLADEAGDKESAQEFFQKALSHPNARPEAYAGLARILTYEQQQPAMALDLLNRMVEANDDVDTRRIRARWQLDQNQPELAVADLWAGLKHTPDDEGTCTLLLNTIRSGHAGEIELDAIAEYNRFIEHLVGVLEDDPENHTLRTYLASAQWAVGRKGIAIGTLEKGIQITPRRFELHEILVDYLVSNENPDRAQEILDRIPEGTIHAGRYRFLKGRVQMAQQKWAEAVDTMETALGYSHTDASLTARVRVCLALCRRELGDDAGAVESYRTLVQSSPNFEGGRLGMASAYLRSNQTELAIAEYRQLTHVEGVPEFLANLLIRQELSKSAASRNWEEIEALLEEENPVVKDDVQRVLLQADLLFARGLPAQAIDKLNAAARRMPDREEIQRAYRRVSSIHGDGLRNRIQKLLDEDSQNLEAHIAMLRLFVAGEDQAGIVLWLDRLLAGKGYSNMSPLTAQQIVAKGSQRVAESELATRGKNELTAVLLKYSGEAWEELSAQSENWLPNHVEFVAKHQSVESAIGLAERTSEAVSSEIVADCMLACLRNTDGRNDLQLQINNQIVKLIRDNPGSIRLRLKYADAKIQLQQYAEAEQVLQQIIKYDGRDVAARSRLAWLELLVNQRPEAGLKLASDALSKSGQSPAIRVKNIYALALIANGRAEEGLKILRSARATERTSASRVFEAQALAALGHNRAAATLVIEISATLSAMDLLPPERKLLTALQEQIDADPPSLTSVP